MKIENFDLDKDILTIAEIGNNHEGSYVLAEEMIGLAANAGAGAVKFQTIIPDKLVSINKKDRIQQLERFRLSYNDFERLSKVARMEGVLFLSTPFDLKSARFLADLVPAFKIASGDNNFFPLIDVIARTGKPIILSAGMTDLDQIRTVKDYIYRIWDEERNGSDLALLHCVVDYPTSPAAANLLFIKELQRLNVTVGYSDHTIGVEAAVLSVALGARIIEKHFTISKKYSTFRDHQLSADAQDFAEMVQKIKQTQKFLGDGVKSPLECEKAININVRRSIVANRDLRAGSTIKWEDLNWVRPGDGLEPGRERELIGKKLIREIPVGNMINLSDIN